MAKRNTEPTEAAAAAGSADATVKDERSLPATRHRHARIIPARTPDLPEAPRYHAPALRLMLVREAPGAYRDRPVIDHPAKAAAVLKDVLGALAQERFVVLLLNVRNRLLGVLNVSEGSLTSCSADPKVIFSAALLAGAPHLILAHNHPSGDPTPSPERPESDATPGRRREAPRDQRHRPRGHRGRCLPQPLADG